jgi:hypothetical protein
MVATFILEACQMRHMYLMVTRKERKREEAASQDPAIPFKGTSPITSSTFFH